MTARPEKLKESSHNAAYNPDIASVRFLLGRDTGLAREADFYNENSSSLGNGQRRLLDPQMESKKTFNTDSLA
jgi:hypothetical protein